MSPEQIVAIFTGFAGIIAAVTTLLSRRSQKIETEQRSQRARIRWLEKRLFALTGYAFELELAVARRDGVVPPRPEILEETEYDDARR